MSEAVVGAGVVSRDASTDPNADRSTRPVIEHALTVYFDGNAELARTLIDRLLSENEAK